MLQEFENHHNNAVSVTGKTSIPEISLGILGKLPSQVTEDVGRKGYRYIVLWTANRNVEVIVKAFVIQCNFLPSFSAVIAIIHNSLPSDNFKPRSMSLRIQHLKLFGTDNWKYWGEGGGGKREGVTIPKRFSCKGILCPKNPA